MDSFTDDLNSPLSKQMQLEMMDDVRPSSLPTIDCAASNARRIEGRPDTALERGTVASASKVVSREDPFRNLSDDILEHILAKLSLFSLVVAKKVCKRWKSVTSTPEFNILRKGLNPKPCLLQCGRSVSYQCGRCVSYDPLMSQWSAYDVENNAWVTLPALHAPDHNYGSIRGSSGVVFAFHGPDGGRFLYKLTSSASSAESFGKTWFKTPYMKFPRWLPVVSVADGAGMGHKVVVAGGGDDNRRDCDHRAVEVFDSEIGTWESYDDLPFSHWNDLSGMSGVVCDNKLYVSLLEELQIHVLDLYTKQWASIQLERPKDLKYHNIIAIGTTLVLAGLFEDSTTHYRTLKLWKVDLKTLMLIQIGLLPSEMAAFLNKPSLLPWTFLVDENLVYVHSLGDGEIALAEVSLEECKTCWRLLPAHPVKQGPIRFDKWITFLASISSA